MRDRNEGPGYRFAHPGYAYFAVIACDKREAFAQGSARDEAIHLFHTATWIASLRSQ
jgi:hypothetical protein